jgi:stearoyl-CoA desaturase (Delta-9 desaturase)
MAPRNFESIQHDSPTVEFNSEAIIPNEEELQAQVQAQQEQGSFKTQLVWKNILIMTFLHTGAIIGFFLVPYAKYQTLLFSIFLWICGGLGITAGAHRLWAHRTYKARLPLRILLALFNTLALQNDIFDWSRDHRVHHKYSETDADPHNINRGFFFAHVGWLLMKKHPEVLEKGKKMYLQDLLDDPVVYYQRKYYRVLAILVCFVLPTIIPYYFWNESLTIAYFIPAIFRYVFTLNATWFVNSFAHMYGQRPYDKRIQPSENEIVSFFALGEGFHNYHHTFPQDYATSEYGFKYLNFTKGFIDLMAFLGLAYDLNRVSGDMVLKRRMRTGDLQKEN